MIGLLLLLCITALAYATLNYAGTIPAAEQRALQAMRHLRVEAGLTSEPNYGALEGLLDGVPVRVSMTPTLEPPEGFASGKMFTAFLVLVLSPFVPVLGGLLCMVSGLGLGIYLVVGITSLNRRHKASGVTLRAEAFVQNAKGVVVRQTPETRGFHTGDAAFDGAFVVGGERLPTMALLGPDERSVLLSLGVCELYGSSLRLELSDPATAVHFTRVLADAAKALSSPQDPTARLLERVRDEVDEAPRLAAIETLLDAQVPERTELLYEYLGHVGVDPEDHDAVAALLDRRDSTALVALAFLGHHGGPVHLPAMQTLSDLWPRHASAAIASVRDRIGGHVAGGIDLAEEEARGRLSKARRGGELSKG